MSFRQFDIQNIKRRYIPRKIQSSCFRMSIFINAFIFCLIGVFFSDCISGQENNIIANESTINIGSRLELFVDDYIIEQIKGSADLKLHHPVPREVAILHDEPWEGNASGYHTVFQDDGVYKMYYRGWQLNIEDDGSLKGTKEHYCYAESNDGIIWKKPNLNQYNFNGSKNNNILEGLDSHSVSIFKDSNPATIPDAKYKALVLKKGGLFALKSADGIHWSSMNEEAVITDGAFDSQNVAFWDIENKEYRAYWRYFDEESGGSRFKGVRAIRTATSKDFIHWENQADLRYQDSLRRELYTNQILPYYRAPDLLIGFPNLYLDRGWSESMRNLPEPDHRKLRSSSSERYGTAITEGLFIASHNRVQFKRWNEAFLRPGIERIGTWNYGQNYIGWGLVETKSFLEGAPNELSIYSTEGYWTGTSDILRRYTLRIDGFVSVYAPMDGGELITKNLVFEGSKLILNFSSSAAGDIRVEIQDESGVPIPGYTLDDCPPVFGDSIEREVYWEKGSDVSRLKGKPVRLRFVLRDTDLFSFQFK